MSVAVDSFMLRDLAEAAASDEVHEEKEEEEEEEEESCGHRCMRTPHHENPRCCTTDKREPRDNCSSVVFLRAVPPLIERTMKSGNVCGFFKKMVGMCKKEHNLTIYNHK